jgi:hypothetical protein
MRLMGKSVVVACVDYATAGRHIRPRSRDVSDLTPETWRGFKPIKRSRVIFTRRVDRNDARGIAQVVRTGWFKQVQVKFAAAGADACGSSQARGPLTRRSRTSHQGTPAASWAQSRSCDADPVRSAGSGIGSLRRHAGCYHLRAKRCPGFCHLRL